MSTHLLPLSIGLSVFFTLVVVVALSKLFRTLPGSGAKNKPSEPKLRRSSSPPPSPTFKDLDVKVARVVIVGPKCPVCSKAYVDEELIVEVEGKPLVHLRCIRHGVVDGEGGRDGRDGRERPSRT